MEQFRFLERHLLDLEVIPRRLPLDEVGGEGVRTPDEPEHRRLRRHLLPQRAQRLRHEGGRGARIDGVHLLDVVPRPHGRHDRPDPLVDVELDPQSRQGREYVAEEYAPVGAVVAVRLERHLHGHVGYLGPLAEGGVPLAQIAVFGNVPSGLPHHPHRHPLGLLAPRGADQEGIDRLPGRIDVRLGHRRRFRHRRRRFRGGGGGCRRLGGEGVGTRGRRGCGHDGEEGGGELHCIRISLFPFLYIIIYLSVLGEEGVG